MTKYATRFEARKALSKDGYIVAHTRPGTPMLWVRKGDATPDRRCVYGSDVAGWTIVPYPELNWLDE